MSTSEFIRKTQTYSLGIRNLSENVVIAGFDFSECDEYLIHSDRKIIERAIPKKRLEFICHVKFIKNPRENLKRVILKSRIKTE